jgi:hypothetical protein
MWKLALSRRDSDAHYMGSSDLRVGRAPGIRLDEAARWSIGVSGQDEVHSKRKMLLPGRSGEVRTPVPGRHPECLVDAGSGRWPCYPHESLMRHYMID